LSQLVAHTVSIKMVFENLDQERGMAPLSFRVLCFYFRL
jgi:hypothetical protein